MTMLVALGNSRAWPIGQAWRARMRWSAVLSALCVPAVWIFASGYSGIEGDARIYMARALADLDPNGVGRDLMFAQDGQSAFSIFRFFAAWLVGLLGPARAGLVLAGLNLVVWFAAMAVFTSRFKSGRAWGLLLVCAAVLPCPYGFYPLMGSREIIAVPRPVSEAAVLLGLAAICQGRVALSFALLGFAAFVHPIMALPGFAVVFVVQGLGDRRWFVAAALILAATATAAIAGLPLFARLASVIDAPWRTLLENRNPYLFIGLWPEATLGPIAVQLFTLITAGLLCEGRQRSILLSAALVGVAGVGVAWVFGDMMSLLLVVQAQPWRSLWLVSVLAMPALGLCLLRLPKQGPLGLIALAFFALAWATFDIMPLTPIAAAFGCGLALASRTRTPAFSRVFVTAVWLIAVGLAFVFKWQEASLAWSIVQAMPAFKADMFGPLWRGNLLPVPCVILAFAWAFRRPHRRDSALAGFVLAALGVVIVANWDHRSIPARRIETNVHDAALSALVASKPGEVLWLTNDDGWYWLGRPQWSSFTQGSGIVFSRALGLQWAERTNLLISLGLADPARMRPWRSTPKIIVPQLTAPALVALCTRADAPAWLVAPLLEGAAIPPGFGATVWHAPVQQGLEGAVDGTIRWSVFTSYVVVPCAGYDAARAATPSL